VGTDILHFNRYKKDMKIVSDVPRRINKNSQIELVPISENGVSWRELRKLAKNRGTNFGEKDAKFLFKNQQLLPKRPGRAHHFIYVPFPGTVYRASDGSQYIPSFIYYGGRGWHGGWWELHFAWVDENSWHSNSRFVSFRK